MTPLDRISQLTDENAQLRARVAELEADASLHWITEEELRQSRGRVAELEHQLKSEIDARNGWWDNCKQAEQRNAELEAVLRDAQEVLNEYAEDGTHRAARLASGRIDAALARAESATPAKPDTEFWQPASTAPENADDVLAYYQGVYGPCLGFLSCKRFHPYGSSGSEQFTHWARVPAIDAARKQETA